MGDNGKIIHNEQEEPKEQEQQEKAQTDEEGHLAKIKVGDKEYKVVNTAKVIEIIVHRLENGKEVSQVIAHEFMMVEHKKYMVKLLTEAINTVMRAEKRSNMVRIVSEAMFNKLKNHRRRMRDIFPKRRR